MMKRDLFIKLVFIWGLFTGFTDIHAAGVTEPVGPVILSMRFR